jgi:hypothetical protein
MARNNRPFEDLTETAAHAVEQNMDKARGAMDNYFNFFQNFWGRNDLTEKMIIYTQKNISAYAQFVVKLGQAQNFQEVIRIQTEFMQTQWNSFTEQARSLGEAYNKAATDATRSFRMFT